MALQLLPTAKSDSALMNVMIMIVSCALGIVHQHMHFQKLE